MRFAIAVTGLAAWLVPWGAIRIALPSSDTLVAALSGPLGVAAGFAPVGTSVAGCDTSARLR